METKRLYIDGEGDLFWLDHIDGDGGWVGCWLRIDGELVLNSGKVSAAFIEAVGMTRVSAPGRNRTHDDPR